MLAVAGMLFVVLRGRGPQPSPPRGSGSGSGSGHHKQPATAVGPPSPAVTVQSYFSAINDHDYQRAWALGGKNTGQSYASFVQGFDETADDNVTILSVTGGVVTVRLDATQTNGTVKHFHGTYTVSNGVITVSRIQTGV
jgi:hypothetical protein